MTDKVIFKSGYDYVTQCWVVGPRTERGTIDITAATEKFATSEEADARVEVLNSEVNNTNVLAKIDTTLAKARGEWSADDILKREG